MKRSRNETNNTRDLLNATKSTPASQLPSSLVIKFTSHDGNVVGSTVEIPIDSTPSQLEILLNSYFENEEKRPYGFYINELELEGTLLETLEKSAATASSLNFEDVIPVIFEPLAMYRVRPVTRCVETMPGHTDSILHISFSPDGKRLASGGGDMTVRFWNTITSMPMHTCIGHKHHVLCTAWSPDGRVFISGDRSGEIRVWNPTTGTPEGREMKNHTKFVSSLSFQPFHLDPQCLKFASSSKDKTIIIWNLLRNQAEATLYGHLDSVECVKWGGNGLLYSCSRDRTIKVWSTDEPSHYKLVRTLSGHAHRINSLALNCDYVLRTGPFRLGYPIPDFATSSQEVLAELREISLTKYQAVVGSEGEKLVSCSDDFTLFMWRPQEGKSPLIRMTGRHLASASFDKKIKLWCGRTGKFLATLNGHVGAVYQVAWSPDSNYLVSGSKDSTVKLWSMKNMKKAQCTLPGHEDEVYALDWSPGASSVASGSKDRTIKIWGH